MLPVRITESNFRSLIRFENDIPNPPCEKDIFHPLATSRFSTPIMAFLTKFFRISHFSTFFTPYPFSHFLSPFCLFLLHFTPFSFLFSYFFSQMTSADIPPPRGESIIQYTDPRPISCGSCGFGTWCLNNLLSHRLSLTRS
jgi:hypothetical protein